MKKTLSILMAVLLLIAWYTTLDAWLGNDGRYQEYMEEAGRLEEKGLYLDAISVYEQARELKTDTLEIDERIADDYLAMGDYKKYRNQLQQIIAAHGPVEADVRRLCEYYRQYTGQRSLIGCVVDLYTKYPDSDVVREYYDSVKGLYTEDYMSLSGIGTFQNGHAVYELNGKKGIISLDGDIDIEAVYDEAAYGGQDDRITVQDEDGWYFVNLDGFKTAVPEGSYEYMGFLSQKRIAARQNGKYGYLDKNLKEKIAFVYDDATAFCEDVAAVKQGDRWALIDRMGENITDFIYDDVAVNSLGICSLNGVIGVKQGEVWSFVNDKGEPVGTGTFQEIKAFESGEPCAVRTGDKWCYADTEGNIVLECGYQDAESFSNGFAPVCRNGLWGYIDPNGYEAVECAFEQAGQMAEGGTAPVSRSGSWTLIRLEAMD